MTLQTENDSVIGTVADSGIGIAGEDQSRLFEDFFRTDEAKESGEIGTGLGLTIVKQAVESYGGKIRVNSQLGEGSRFTFILPKEPGLRVAHLPPSEQDSSAASDSPDVTTDTPSAMLGHE